MSGVRGSGSAFRAPVVPDGPAPEGVSSGTGAAAGVTGPLPSARRRPGRGPRSGRGASFEVMAPAGYR